MEDELRDQFIRCIRAICKGLVSASTAPGTSLATFAHSIIRSTKSSVQLDT
ncbi:hypothetical protein [Nostoc sp.]|uniref:hypothetical protein n=1 Tax=Nostoc sp. TaxID=1180 RepID=UPI002FF6BD1B